MDLTKGAIEKIEDLVEKGCVNINPVVEVDGVKFWKNTGNIVETDQYPQTLIATNLSALISYLNFLPDSEKKDLFVFVRDNRNVTLYHNDLDQGLRHVVVNVWLNDKFKSFSFDRYHSKEDFIIQLLSKFEETEDLKKLIETAAFYRKSEENTTEDNLSSQNKKTERKTELGTKQYIFNLAPFRTFREIKQPVSSFLFRTNKDGEFALFEADGGAWAHEAEYGIRSYLKGKVDVEVI